MVKINKVIKFIFHFYLLIINNYLNILLTVYFFFFFVNSPFIKNI